MNETVCYAWPSIVTIYHRPGMESDRVTQDRDRVTCPACVSALRDPWVPRREP